MTHPRYPVYKDSGVAWLGEVPAHWDVKPLFGTVIECNEPNKGMQEDNLLSLSYGRIVCKDITSNDGLLPESFETYQIVRPNDIVFRLTDLQNDKRSLRSAIVREHGIITSAYLAVRAISAEPEYLSYLFRSYDTTKVFYSMGGGLRQAMKFSDLKRMPTVLPSKSEQQAIAQFLDIETAKIDALISEQEELIRLLKEKRQAVISHAVTKGLNPKAKLRESGVAWLGAVPKHWEVKRLKQMCNVFPSNVDKKSYEDEMPVKLCNYTDVYYNEKIVDGMELMDATATPEQIKKFTLRAGDTIITKDSETADDIAIAAYVPKDLPGVICGYHLSMVRPRVQTHGAFVKRLFDSTYAKSSFAVLANGLTRVGLGSYALDNVEMPFPPFTEQQAIAQFLDVETAKLDTLTSEALRAIELLRERRTALISAAVTGKMDVRAATTLESV